MTSMVDTNSQAVEQIFRSHYRWLCGWVARRSRKASAEDVASEVYLRLMVLPYVSELREPRAMMTTMAARILSDWRRRAGLRRALEAELDNAVPGLAPSPEDTLLIVETLRRIEAILSTLCPRARAAFLLNRVDGMTQQEIAGRLGVSVRTVERYLAQGMRMALRLRRDL